MTDEEAAALAAALATLATPEDEAPEPMPRWRRAMRLEAVGSE